MKERHPAHHGPKEKKGPAGRAFLTALELLAVALSFLERSRIARFLSTKVALDTVVEVTARFGRDAGHRLSTCVAVFVAEPRLIAVLVAGVIVCLHLLAWLLRRLFPPYVAGRVRAAALLNCLIVVLECMAAVRTFTKSGIGSLWFYTVLSNLLALAASVLYLLALGGGRLRRVADLWRYAASVCLTVTCLVVVFVLVPTDRSGDLMTAAQSMLLSEDMRIQHLLCPVMSFVSFVFFEDVRLRRGDWLRAALPTFLYAAVLVPANYLRVYEGPYPFLMVHSQPWQTSVLWSAAILGGVMLLSWLLGRGKARGPREPLAPRPEWR